METLQHTTGGLDTLERRLGTVRLSPLHVSPKAPQESSARPVVCPTGQGARASTGPPQLRGHRPGGHFSLASARTLGREPRAARTAAVRRGTNDSSHVAAACPRLPAVSCPRSPRCPAHGSPRCPALGSPRCPAHGPRGVRVQQRRRRRAADSRRGYSDKAGLPVGQGATDSDERCSGKGRGRLPAPARHPAGSREGPPASKRRLRGSGEHGAGYGKSEKVSELPTGLKESYFSPEISQQRLEEGTAASHVKTAA